MPTNLSAVVSGKTLMVSGEAAQSLYSQVSITRGYDSVEVKDNGTVGVLVPIQGTALATHHINASAVTGAGVQHLQLFRIVAGPYPDGLGAGRLHLRVGQPPDQ